METEERQYSYICELSLVNKAKSLIATQLVAFKLLVQSRMQDLYTYDFAPFATLGRLQSTSMGNVVRPLFLELIREPNKLEYIISS